ncbi:MAG: transporter [Rhizobiaceae bacterium]
MPSASEIQNSMIGAWRLLLGRREGMRQLDTTADGFWDSFFAMLVALPALLIGWVAFANDLVALPEVYGSRSSIIARLFVAEAGKWVVPIVALAIAARPLGIADRFVPYVVASNWATAVLVWLTLPLPLLRLALGSGSEIVMALSLGVFIATLVLSWRLTNAVLERGPGTATAVVVAMVVFSILLALWLETALGLYVPDASLE